MFIFKTDDVLTNYFTLQNKTSGVNNLAPNLEM